MSTAIKSTQEDVVIAAGEQVALDAPQKSKWELAMNAAMADAEKTPNDKNNCCPKADTFKNKALEYLSDVGLEPATFLFLVGGIHLVGYDWWCFWYQADYYFFKTGQDKHRYLAIIHKK